MADAKADDALSGKRLRELRTQAGLSQQALGMELGACAALVCRWERGQRPLPLRALEWMAQVGGGTCSAPTWRTGLGLRRRWGLTQRQFGEVLGVCGATVGRWERRPSRVPLRVRQILKVMAERRLERDQVAAVWQEGGAAGVFLYALGASSPR